MFSISKQYREDIKKYKLKPGHIVKNNLILSNPSVFFQTQKRKNLRSSIIAPRRTRTRSNGGTLVDVVEIKRSALANLFAAGPSFHPERCCLKKRF